MADPHGVANRHDCSYFGGVPAVDRPEALLL
jgi:hypothetical protein